MFYFFRYSRQSNIWGELYRLRLSLLVPPTKSLSSPKLNFHIIPVRCNEERKFPFTLRDHRLRQTFVWLAATSCYICVWYVIRQYVRSLMLCDPSMCELSGLSVSVNLCKPSNCLYKVYPSKLALPKNVRASLQLNTNDCLLTVVTVSRPRMFLFLWCSVYLY